MATYGTGKCGGMLKQTLSSSWRRVPTFCQKPLCLYVGHVLIESMECKVKVSTTQKSKAFSLANPEIKRMSENKPKSSWNFANTSYTLHIDKNIKETRFMMKINIPDNGRFQIFECLNFFKEAGALKVVFIFSTQR